MEEELQEEVNAALPNKEIAPDVTESKLQKPSVKPNSIESSSPVTCVDDLFAVDEDNNPSLDNSMMFKEAMKKKEHSPTTTQNYGSVSIPALNNSNKSKDVATV